MKKYFIFSDVHGYFNELILALNNASFDITDDNHILISCGDNFDRGPNNYDVFKFLKSIPKHRIFLIKGNHEKMLQDIISTFQIYRHDKINGTAATYFELAEHLDDNRLVEVMDFINDMNYYVEINNHIFTHGFIPLGINYANATDDEWETALWTNSSRMINLLPKINKTVVVGHVHTSYFHDKNEIYYQEKTTDKCGFIAIDGGSYKTGKINILVMNEDGTYDNQIYKNTLKDITK